MFARRGVLLSARWLALVVSALVAVAVLALVAPSTKAEAAELPGTILDGGYIISDAEFYDSGAMTEKQIETFLDGKVSSCKSGYTCLKDYKGDIAKRAADTYCKAVAAEKGVSSARIIYQAAKACGINPKVLIVMLQKEQGLVTMNNPDSTRYARALGFSCPDTPQGCDPKFAGFSTQVVLGARQMQIYTKYPSSFSYRAGQYNTIKWAPSSSCGTSKVFIKNQATANLYNYTPYRPNIAALAAGWGTGDACSTYGNRNFYNYYVSWFAPGASTSKGAPAQVSACTNPATADVSTRSGSATVNVLELNARTAPTTLCGSGIHTLKKGDKVTVTGVYGAWTHITVGSTKLWVVSSYLTTGSASSGPAPAVTGCAQPAKVTSASGTAVVTVGLLNARTAPSTDCATGVQTIKQGQKYTRTGTYGAWWRLKVGTTTLWAHSDYLALEQEATTPSKPLTPTTQTAKTTAALNLRASASLSAKVLTVIPKGKSVTVKKTSGNWSQVTYSSTTGWVANAYLSGFKTSVPTASKPSTGTTTSKTATVKVALNLRSSNSLSAKVITVLPRGAKVTVTKTSGSWSHVTYGSKSGWVYNDYLSTSSAAASTTMKKTTAPLNLRSSGSLSAKVLTVIPKGKAVTVKKTSGSWSQVTYGSKSGWVANQYLK
ncbi:hypothetical protein ET475_11770 [Microbacterium protaetiae]|uniref:SH3b domain-containing protein n=1 Tax=Microbacterium protaetiae TaxID=2509458 RepID=A0A4P6EE73_9MICO|nr:SH3 domain-containing protein [Microbacterium protaetiae]QAY60600.1 hypothetical protein ET475_11770 [Microbacterium protaetiae]